MPIRYKRVRYRGTAQRSCNTSHQDRQSTSLSLSPFPPLIFRSIYIIHLELGTPPKRYPFQLDLASSDLLIASSLCTGDTCPDVKDSRETPLYVPGQSRSFEPIDNNGTTFNLTYADASSARGFLALERIGIAGAGGEVIVQDQVIGVVNETTMNLRGLGVSGIVGLGFARGSVFVREGLEGTPSEVSVSASRTTGTTPFSTTPSSTTTSDDSTSAFFSILPIETITPIPIPTSTTLTRRTALSRRAETPTYFPPLLETLFSRPSINASSPHLAYPVFSLALANTSAPFSAGNGNASITWGGVSGAFVAANGSDAEGGKPMVQDIDWVPVVPFARALSAPPINASELDTLEGEAYLYWAVPLENISLNGTQLTPEPTYNSSLTGAESSIALLDAGTNGIFGPQQDVLRIFEGIKDARQVAQGQWAVPCDTEMTLSFRISNTEITLQPSEWMAARVSGGTMCLAWPRVAAPSADGVDWQLGTPVLRKVVTVFSGGIAGEQGPLVGFLPLRSSPTTTSTTTTATTTLGSAMTLPATVSVQNASEIMAHITQTINTALPNVLLPDPSYTTPPYLFTTPPVPSGAEVSGGLGNPLVYQVSEVPVVQTSAPSMTAGQGTRTVGASTVGRPSEAATGNSATSGAVVGPRAVGYVLVAMTAMGTAVIIC